MAVITTSTFDPLKARVNVRLQQGVPIVDADWNELDDIRKFELRAYLKWYVGDGIPDGSDAFRIDAITPAVTDNCIIRAGVAVPPAGTTNYDQGLRFAGRAIVDGLDVIIPADINYKAQPLFTAAAFGVPQIAPLPTAAGPIAVYLDVWERLVTSQEDPSLVLSGIGTESCARMKREWCVRSRSANVVPRPTDSDFIAGHSYYLLAVINRRVAGGNPVPIAPTDVLDRRHVKLSLASIESRLALIEQLLLTPRFAASPNQFTPKLGPPGARVDLFGNNFNVGTVTVRFGTAPATIAGTPSPSQISATVPSVAPGAVKITVQTGGGSVTSIDDFTILPPPPTFAASPNQFTPKLGPPGASVDLFGNNFNVGTVTVRFGTAPATIAGTPSPSQISATVPSVAPGAVKITVQTGGGSVTSIDDFTILLPPPTFAASPNQFNPKSGLRGSSINLFGNNFNVGTVTVRFGTAPSTIIGTPTASQIIATIPQSLSPGDVVKITVQTGGGSVTSTDDFTVAA